MTGWLIVAGVGGFSAGWVAALIWTAWMLGRP